MLADKGRRHATLSAVALLAALLLLVPVPSGRAQEYTARVGDVLDIIVVGEADVSRLVTVSPEGNIFLPLIGNLAVAGLTLPQIEEKLKLSLSRFIKEPKVLVTFRQANPEKEFVYVLGQVRRPGPYEFRKGWTVAELFAMAGGAMEGAAVTRAVVLRRSTAIPVNLQKLLAGDVSQNPELKPGDVLMVPEMTVNERVLVLGEVAKPGYQEIAEGDRIVDTITKAGGPTIKAAPEKISILRNGNTVTADLEAFLRQGVMDQNVTVQPGDVIFVPETDRRVLVMGEVEKPGPYTLTPKAADRVLDLIMRAGGPKKGANMSKVVIVRQTAQKAENTQVNLDSALRNGGTSQNMVVQPGDVIFVPGGFGIQFKDILESLSGLRLLRTLFGLP